MNTRRPQVDREALVAATMTMGFSEEVARAGIDAELEAWSEPAIEATLAAELGASASSWRSIAAVAPHTVSP